MRPTTTRTYPATRTPHASKAAVCAWCGIDVKGRYDNPTPVCVACRPTENAFKEKQ